MKNKALTNKFNRTIISAVLMIALAFSMIGGATLAIFTSTSSVNVAITSGTVSVMATPKNFEVYSPELINPDGTIQSDKNIANQTTKTFAGGGTAVLEGSTLKLNKIAAGDSVSFDIDYSNESNIKAKYRLAIIGKGLTTKNADGTDRNGTALLAALRITFSENDKEPVTYDRIRTYISAWRELPVSTTEVSTLHVKVELPADRGNEYQNRACQISFQINAVQSNTDTTDYDGLGKEITEENPHIETFTPVFTAQELMDEVAAIPAGGSGNIVFGENISTPRISRTSYNVDNNKNVTIDLDNYKMSLTDSYASIVIKDNATLAIKNGTFNAKRTESTSPLFFLNGSADVTDATPDALDSLVLDNVTINYETDTTKVTNAWTSVISSNAKTTKRKVDVNVNKCTFNVKGPMNCAVYLPSLGKKTFKDTTITGDGVATSFFITSGDWNITGGSYVGNQYKRGAANEFVQDALLSSKDEKDTLWENPATNFDYKGEIIAGAITTLNGGYWGTGDAICIVNRYSNTLQQVLGTINISSVRLTVGNVALSGDKLTNAQIGDVLSGPSGYGVRIYDVKEHRGAISVKGLTVTSGKQVVKGETANTEVALPKIHVTTAGEGNTRVYSGVSEYVEAAR